MHFLPSRWCCLGKVLTLGGNSCMSQVSHWEAGLCMLYIPLVTVLLCSLVHHDVNCLHMFWWAQPFCLCPALPTVVGRDPSETVISNLLSSYLISVKYFVTWYKSDPYNKPCPGLPSAHHISQASLWFSAPCLSFPVCDEDRPMS